MREIRPSGLGGRGSASRSSYPHLWRLIPPAVTRALRLQFGTWHSFRLGAIGHGPFAEDARIGRNRTATNGKFAFAHGIKHPQFFRHGPRGEVAAQGAFAFENLLQVEAHGASPRNCRSNFRHASTSACRARMA